MRNILRFGIASSLLVAAVVAGAERQDYLEKLLKVGTKAPNFSLPNTAGKQQTLASLSKGKKATIVNFWFYG
jgi:hypothetical protein